MDTTSKALHEDIYKVTRPLGHLSSKDLELYNGNIAEISALFDVITYKKGAAILRYARSVFNQAMNLSNEFDEATIASDVFFKGIQSYVQKYKYANVNDSFDFWDEMQKAVDTEKQEMIAHFKHITSTSSFPFLFVKIQPGTENVIITQRAGRYNNMFDNEILHNSRVPCSSDDPCWNVHIRYIDSQSSNPGWFSIGQDRESTVSVDTHDSWLKLNAEQLGYYRVIYSEDLLRKLATAISSPETMHRFTDEDVAGLLDDLLAYSILGGKPALLQITMLIGYVVQRQVKLGKVEYSSCTAILNVLDHIGDNLSDTTCFDTEKFDELREDVIRPLIAMVPWINGNFVEDIDEPIDMKLLRQRLYNMKVSMDINKRMQLSPQICQDVLHAMIPSEVTRIHVDSRRALYGIIASMSNLASLVDEQQVDQLCPGWIKDPSADFFNFKNADTVAEYIMQSYGQHSNYMTGDPHEAQRELDFLAALKTGYSRIPINARDRVFDFALGPYMRRQDTLAFFKKMSDSQWDLMHDKVHSTSHFPKALQHKLAPKQGMWPEAFESRSIYQAKLCSHMYGQSPQHKDPLSNANNGARAKEAKSCFHHTAASSFVQSMTEKTAEKVTYNWLWIEQNRDTMCLVLKEYSE